MIKYGPNSKVLVNGAPGEAHYIALMQQWRWIDFFLNPNVKSKELTDPPASPADGAAYIIPQDATGDWSGQAGNIARWSIDTVPPKWEIMAGFEGMGLIYNLDDGKRYQFTAGQWSVFSSGGGSGGGGSTGDIILAASDVDTPLTTGVFKAYAPAARGGTIVGVKANLRQASSLGSIAIDIKKNGISILSVPLSIDQNETTSLTANSQAVLINGAVGEDDRISVDITASGSGARGLIVTLLFALPAGAAGTWGSIGGFIADQLDLKFALAGKVPTADFELLEGRVDALEAGGPGSGGARSYSAPIGDGAAANFIVEHNLGTRDVHVSVYRSATPWETILPDVSRLTENSVEIYGFSTAPAQDEYRVVVSK